MLRFASRPFRSSQDQQTPADRQISSKPLSRRGSASYHEPRVLVRTKSRDIGPGRHMDAGGGGRSRNRSSSTPPEFNRIHHHPPQNGQTRLFSASAEASWEYGEHWAHTSWTPGHTQTVQLQVNSRMAMVVQGQPGDGDHHRGRARHSSDAKRLSFVPPTPSSPTEPPVIPRFTTPEGMGFWNLFGRSSRDPPIRFYKKHEPYYEFTNFSPHPVVYQGKRYPTSEHLFQALKVSARCYCDGRILLI